jgi:hypothetical protein
MVCAVAFSLVGMHHVASEPVPVVVSTSDHAPHGDHDDEALHLCMVALTALVVLALYPLRRLKTVEPPREAPVPVTPPRAPPPSAVLDSLCVLRL